MTAQRITKVTHPDGTVSKRTSKTRTYTHAIEVSPAPADRYAAHLTRQAAEQDARAAQFRAAAAGRKGTIRSRGFRTQDDHVSHVATLNGAPKELYTWCGTDQMTEKNYGTGELVPVLQYLIDQALESATDCDARAAALRAESDTVLAAGVPVGEYMVLRWSSRADLAHAALGEFGWYSSQGFTVRVVAVD